MILQPATRLGDPRRDRPASTEKVRITGRGDSCRPLPAGIPARRCGRMARAAYGNSSRSQLRSVFAAVAVDTVAEPAGSASPTACRPARSRPRCAVHSATRPDHRCPRDACAACATVAASANPIAVNPTKVRRRYIVRPHQCPSRCRARESVVPLAIGTDVLRWVDRRRFCAASGNGCFRLRLRASTTPTARLGTRWRLRRLRPVSAVRQGTIELRVRRHGSPRLAA